MAYKEIRFTGISMETMEILIAQLADLQYEGFEELENGFRAFTPESSFDKVSVDELARKFDVEYSADTLPDTNWNQLWELNFQPVIVEDFCAVRADFHEPVSNVQHEIVITPKMSFGTGHHPTTYMMILQMKQIDFNNKSVMDFGTGTGVLAILAEKLGAGSIIAIDNDDWSIANAEENIVKNNARAIKIIKADNAGSEEKSDIILANITRNVIADNFALFAENITGNGVLLLSGLLADDENFILNEADAWGFELQKKIQRDNWISLKFLFKKS